jgi:hypothetical protein
MKRSCFLFLFLLNVITVRLFAVSEDLRIKLQAIEGISAVEPLESEHYSEKYSCKIKQFLDHNDTTAGSFTQRVIVNHIGFDRPTVLVTEGYGAAYALREEYQDELSRLFNMNVVFVEHRYFLESTPDPLNWDYLTAENSAYDLHHIIDLFKKVYPEKWVSSGISKGGQTTLLIRAYFPDDVDFSVPYVAPWNRAVEDGRHEKFLKHVGTKKERKRIEQFQKTVLKKRTEILPLLTNYCKEHNLEFRIPMDEVLDYTVLEYDFAFWQWGTAISTIPASSSDVKTLFDHLMSVSSPDYFAENQAYISFNVQAARELGYYGYDIAPFRKWLHIQSAENYFNRIMVPQGVSVTFDSALYHKVYAYLEKNDPKMIFIYGEVDPWSASRVPDFKGKKNMQIYIQPRGSHRTRISTMPEELKTKIIAQINAWLRE